MGHEHHHGNTSTYLTEQLCMIVLCGALGAIAVAMYLRNPPGEVPQFQVAKVVYDATKKQLVVSVDGNINRQSSLDSGDRVVLHGIKGNVADPDLNGTYTIAGIKGNSVELKMELDDSTHQRLTGWTYQSGGALANKPWLGLFLASMFWFAAYLGGIALLVMVAIRALSLWRLTGKPAGVAASAQGEHVHAHHHEGCEHGHTHEHEHQHDHATCGHDHSHENGHEHSHDHDHEHSHDHSHGDDHGHDHGWNPWRFAVLLFPVVLFFLDLPDASCSDAHRRWLAQQTGKQGDWLASTRGGALNFSPEVGLRLTKTEDGVVVEEVETSSPAAKADIQAGDRILQITRSVGKDGKPDKNDVKPLDLKDLTLDEVLKSLKGKSDDSQVKLVYSRQGSSDQIEKILVRERKVGNLTFDEVERLAFDAGLRRLFDGRRVRIKGRYITGSRPNSFILARYKMVCCGADMRMLPMSIETSEKEDLAALKLKPQQWVEVEGQVQFHQRADRPSEYMTILKVAALNDINSNTASEMD